MDCKVESCVHFYVTTRYYNPAESVTLDNGFQKNICLVVKHEYYTSLARHKRTTIKIILSYK